MNYQKNKKRIIRELLHESDKELTDEELMNEILGENVTMNADKTEKDSFGQKAADAVAKFAGSWAFIFTFIGVMVVWMVVNILMATRAFDSYPFVLLNLVLSCIAAIQAPLIMMSQNRQEAKDRNRAENDYRINLKSEFVIDELYKKVEQISENQKKILKMFEADKKEKTTSCGVENKNGDEYYLTLYDKNAQQFVLDHINEIVKIGLRDAYSTK